MDVLRGRVAFLLNLLLHSAAHAHNREVASRRGFFKMDGFIKEHSRFYAVAGTRSGVS